ncbi:MAG: hypothetical protein KDK40_02515 [Chlamydiia bacterium]|nr:hypothetical protein [Chlamydiia bacterium]
MKMQIPQAGASVVCKWFNSLPEGELKNCYEWLSSAKDLQEGFVIAVMKGLCDKYRPQVVDLWLEKISEDEFDFTQHEESILKTLSKAVLGSKLKDWLKLSLDRKLSKNIHYQLLSLSSDRDDQDLLKTFIAANFSLLDTNLANKSHIKKILHDVNFVIKLPICHIREYGQMLMSTKCQHAPTWELTLKHLEDNYPLAGERTGAGEELEWLLKVGFEPTDSEMWASAIRLGCMPVSLSQRLEWFKDIERTNKSNVFALLFFVKSGLFIKGEVLEHSDEELARLWLHNKLNELLGNIPTFETFTTASYCFSYLLEAYAKAKVSILKSTCARWIEALHEVSKNHPTQMRRLEEPIKKILQCDLPIHNRIKFISGIIGEHSRTYSSAATELLVNLVSHSTKEVQVELFKPAVILALRYVHSINDQDLKKLLLVRLYSEDKLKVLINSIRNNGELKNQNRWMYDLSLKICSLYCVIFIVSESNMLTDTRCIVGRVCSPYERFERFVSFFCVSVILAVLTPFSLVNGSQRSNEGMDSERFEVIKLSGKSKNQQP